MGVGVGVGVGVGHVDSRTYMAYTHACTLSNTRANIHAIHQNIRAVIVNICSDFIPSRSVAGGEDLV